MSLSDNSRTWSTPVPGSTIGKLSQRIALSAAQDGLCTWCKLPFLADFAYTDIDHIIPLSRGGPDLPWNRQLLHRNCNQREKGNRLTPEAEALAAKHGVTLVEPPPRKPWSYWVDPGRRRRFDLLQAEKELASEQTGTP